MYTVKGFSLIAYATRPVFINVPSVIISTPKNIPPTTAGVKEIPCTGVHVQFERVSPP